MNTANPLGVPAHRHINPDGSEGGWVADTATVDSTAWVFGDAQVFGDAWVSGDARVSGNAWVSGDACWLHVSPLAITATVERDGSIAVAWVGERMTLAEFRARPRSPPQGRWNDPRLLCRGHIVNWLPTAILAAVTIGLTATIVCKVTYGRRLWRTYDIAESVMHGALYLSLGLVAVAGLVAIR